MDARRRARADRLAHDRAARGVPASRGAGRGRALPDSVAARRHRQRQDGALSAPRGARDRVGAPGPRARAGNRAHAGRDGPVPRAIRRARRDPAQRALPGRAARPVAAHPPRRDRRRRRHALGRLHAARIRRAHRRRRGARFVVQAGRAAAVSRTGRRGRTRADGRRARRAGIGHAVARIGGQRRGRPLRSRAPHDARARPAAGHGAGRGHARRVRGARSGRDVVGASALGDRGSPVEARAGRRAAQSAGLRDGHLLPPVRIVDGVPALQRRADVPPDGPPRAVSLLQLRLGGAAQVRNVRRRVPRAIGLRHRAARSRPARGVPAGARHPGRSRHDPPEGRDCARAAGRWRPDRSTSSWARR